MQAELRVPLSTDFAQKIADFVDSCLMAPEAAVPAKPANRLRIAADEVASNLMAYSGAAEVLCQFAVQSGEITLTFSDNGLPYDPLAQAAPDTTATAEERSIGGLGLLLVKRLMRDVQYKRCAGQNVLTLRLGWSDNGTT